MNWYLENREDSDVVKSTRIRFVRNINNFNFKLKESERPFRIHGRKNMEYTRLGSDTGLRLFVDTNSKGRFTSMLCHDLSFLQKQ